MVCAPFSTYCKSGVLILTDRFNINKSLLNYFVFTFNRFYFTIIKIFYKYNIHQSYVMYKQRWRLCYLI